MFNQLNFFQYLIWGTSLIACVPFSAKADQISVSTQASSAFIDRGIDLSFGTPVVNINLDYDFDQGYYFSSSIQYGELKQAPRLTQGNTLTAGWFFMINANSAIDISASSHRFIGKFQETWDYNHWDISFHINDKFTAHSSYSDDLYGRGHSDLTFGLHFKDKVNDNFYGVGSLQYAHFSSGENDLATAEVGLGYQWEQLTIELRQFITNRSGNFGYLKDEFDNKLMLQLHYKLY